jgi:methionyl-tRNA formyltransferase
MPGDRLRVVMFSEEGSGFGKRHLAALLELSDIVLCALVVSAAPQRPGRDARVPGATMRARLRHNVWRLLHAAVGAAPAMDLTAFDMAAEAWIRGIRVLRPRRLKDRTFLHALRALAPDVILCAGHQRILPASLLRMAPLAAINFHPSLLPEGRGRNPCFWTIVTGQTRTGVTAHHMSARVDAGDIVLQKAVDLAGTETYTSLYHQLSRMSAGMVPEVLAMCQAGWLPRLPQPAGGSVFGEPAEGDYRIDWSRGADAVERLIRAGMDQPGAYADIGGERVIVCAAGMEPAVTGQPGVILDLSARGVLVGAGSGSLWLTRLRLHGERVPAQEVAAQKGWRIGTRFG